MINKMSEPDMSFKALPRDLRASPDALETGTLLRTIGLGWQSMSQADEGVSIGKAVGERLFRWWDLVP